MRTWPRILFRREGFPVQSTDLRAFAHRFRSGKGRLVNLMPSSRINTPVHPYPPKKAVGQGVQYDQRNFPRL
jgi:hypothetical protein